MYPIPTECPICHDNLLVTRMLCRNCGTALEGRFIMERLFQLTPEQLHFVEIFIRCEGKINRVQEELGLSNGDRQRLLNRMLDKGLIEKVFIKAERGRPRLGIKPCNLAQ